MACLESSELWTESHKVEKKWRESKALEAWGFKNDVTAFNALFEVSTGKPFLEGMDITPMDMRKMNVGVDMLIRDLKSPGKMKQNKFLKHFIPGYAKTRGNPVAAKFWDRLRLANEYHNNQTHHMMESYKNMMGQLKNGILEFDNISYGSDLKAGDRSSLDPRKYLSIFNKNKNAEKHVRKKFDKLNELEKAYYKKSKGKNPTGSELTDLIGDSGFLNNEGSVFEDFRTLVQNGSSESFTRKYTRLDGTLSLTPQRQRYLNRLEQARGHWNDVQSFSKEHLLNSLDKLNETIGMKYGNNKSADYLRKNYGEIRKKLEESDNNYIPHYVLDILGQTIEMQESLSKVKSPQKLDSIIAKAAQQAEEINTGLSARLKSKSSSDVEYFSRNPVLYAQKYIQQTTQFNHRTTLDNAYAHGLKAITGVMLKNPDAKIANTAKYYQGVLESLYSKSGTQRIESSPVAENLTRLLTSLQFTSKLGWSSRGALKNYTQRFLNYAWWGGEGWRDAVSRSHNDTRYSTAMEGELKRHGLMFVDVGKVTEGALTAADLTAYNIDYTKGALTYREKQTVLERLTKAGNTLAEASSKFTQMAENGNRKSTFNVAFNHRLKQLEKSNYYSKWGSDKNIEAQLYKVAGNYAAKMTSLLHFEYSKFGKADIMNTKMGSILGQFQHFAISFADLQYQMAKDYKRAFKAGDYFGEEAHRIRRFAMIYGMTNVVSGLTEIDFTSYINNDTLGRAGELVKFLTGETIYDHITGADLSEKEKKENKMDAFYGKGLVGAVGLVPATDAIEFLNLGQAAGYWKMLADEDSRTAWLLGMRDYDKINDTEFLNELLGMGSIEIDRLINQTLPKLKSHGLMPALRAEFGMYPGETALGMSTREFKTKVGINKEKPKTQKQLTEEERARKALSALANF